VSRRYTLIEDLTVVDNIIVLSRPKLSFFLPKLYQPSATALCPLDERRREEGEGESKEELRGGYI
jgi:hypothetical protein